MVAMMLVTALFGLMPLHPLPPPPRLRLLRPCAVLAGKTTALGQQLQPKWL